MLTETVKNILIDSENFNVLPVAINITGRPIAKNANIEIKKLYGSSDFILITSSIKQITEKTDR